MNASPPTPGKYASDGKEFYLQEYDCLRREVEWLLKDYRNLERYVVVLIGGLWGWLFATHWDTKKVAKLPVEAWWIPVIFALLGSVRTYGIFSAFGQFHGYISSIEDAFIDIGAPGGWEHANRGRPTTAKAALTFWIILLASTTVVAILASFNCI